MKPAGYTLTLLVLIVSGAVLFVIALPHLCSAQTEEAKNTQMLPEPEMVLLPGGEFIMGEGEHKEHSPKHKVRLDPFYIDKYEVTNAHYQAFCEATARRLPEFWGMDEYCSGPDYPNHPVVGVSWVDAMAYARWRGARLPTETEWEYAARGGLVGKKYSHGDTLDIDLYAPGGYTRTASPSSVGSYPPNGYGLHDMTKNVSEWVQDWFDREYYKVSPEDNPTGPGHGRFKIFRGGGWHTGPSCCAVYYRNALPLNWVDFNLGFRCAKYMGESAALKMERVIKESGIEKGLAEYGRMRSADPGEYYFNESEFNEMGYRLLSDDKTADALEVFKLNVKSFPHSYNAYDSLGEVYMTLGNRELAVENYRKSVEIYPYNSGGWEKLRELEDGDQ